MINGYCVCQFGLRTQCIRAIFGAVKWLFKTSVGGDHAALSVFSGNVNTQWPSRLILHLTFCYYSQTFFKRLLLYWYILIDSLTSEILQYTVGKFKVQARKRPLLPPEDCHLRTRWSLKMSLGSTFIRCCWIFTHYISRDI